LVGGVLFLREEDLGEGLNQFELRVFQSLANQELSEEPVKLNLLLNVAILD